MSGLLSNRDIYVDPEGNLKGFRTMASIRASFSLPVLGDNHFIDEFEVIDTIKERLVVDGEEEDPPYFITLEGIDGAGKSRLMEKISAVWSGKCWTTHEPFLEKETQPLFSKIAPTGNVQAYAYIFYVDRMYHASEHIIPALYNDITVFCDRYHDTTRAYQEVTTQADDIGCPTPELTLLLDIAPEIALKRIHARDPEMFQDMGASEYDSFNFEFLGFMAAVRKRYLAIAELEPERFIVINAPNIVYSEDLPK